MQHAVIVGRGLGFLRSGAFRPGCGQGIAEAQKQPQSVELSQVTSGGIPLGEKLVRVLGWTEGRLQLGEGVVVETKISSYKFFFQDGRPGEKRHGGPLCLAAGDQQHFALALKESPGDMAGDIFGESDGAIVKSDVKGGALKRQFANVIDPRFIQPHTAQLQVEGFRGRTRSGSGGRRCYRRRLRAAGLRRKQRQSQPNSASACTGIILITLVT